MARWIFTNFKNFIKIANFNEFRNWKSRILGLWFTASVLCCCTVSFYRNVHGLLFIVLIFYLLSCIVSTIGGCISVTIVNYAGPVPTYYAAVRLELKTGTPVRTASVLGNLFCTFLFLSQKPVLDRRKAGQTDRQAKPVMRPIRTAA